MLLARIALQNLFSKFSTTVTRGYSSFLSFAASSHCVIAIIHLLHLDCFPVNAIYIQAAKGAITVHYSIMQRRCCSRLPKLRASDCTGLTRQLVSVPPRPSSIHVSLRHHQVCNELRCTCRIRIPGSHVLAPEVVPQVRLQHFPCRCDDRGPIHVCDKLPDW